MSNFLRTKTVWVDGERIVLWFDGNQWHFYARMKGRNETTHENRGTHRYRGSWRHRLRLPGGGVDNHNYQAAVSPAGNDNDDEAVSSHHHNHGGADDHDH